MVHTGPPMDLRLQLEINKHISTCLPTSLRTIDHDAKDLVMEQLEKAVLCKIHGVSHQNYWLKTLWEKQYDFFVSASNIFPGSSSGTENPVKFGALHYY